MSKHPHLFLLLVLLTAQFISAQKENWPTDTLIIADRKFPLVHSKKYYPPQDGPVFIASEYRDTVWKKNTIRYAKAVDTLIAIYYDDDQNLLQAVDDNPATGPGEINLYHFLDTVKMTFSDFCDFKLALKTKEGTTGFYASKITYIDGDKIGVVKHKYILGSDIIAFWRPCSDLKEAEIARIKKYRFIVEGLYYTKGPATYFLEREFMIVIKD